MRVGFAILFVFFSSLVGHFIRTNTRKEKETAMNDRLEIMKPRRSPTGKARDDRKLTNPVTFDALPPEIVTEVISRVAASSFTDLFNAKLSWKYFKEAADEKKVFERVSLDKFSIVPWRLSEEAIIFLDSCKENGNPEILYREGMVKYFSHLKIREGLDSLKKAAELGHACALYVLEIILVCSGEELKKEGMNILKGFKRSKSMRRIALECRKSLRRMGIWINNFQILEGKTRCCMMFDQHRRKARWPSDESEEEDDSWCDDCWCDREVFSFLRTFYGFHQG